jgi:putative RNA 2'-phosphotransferase
VEPPPVLFHGTATRFLDSIRRDGLIPGSRRHVHLSADAETATTVGARHGRPAVLRIDAARMHADGHRFFLSANGVWLTDAVPTEYLGFPDDS